MRAAVEVLLLAATKSSALGKAMNGNLSVEDRLEQSRPEKEGSRWIILGSHSDFARCQRALVDTVKVALGAIGDS